MQTIWNLARGRAGLAIAAGLTLFGTDAAMATSVLLPPGSNRVVPSTTAATEPDLNGFVQLDDLVPFTIRNAAGKVVCAGQLQDRVVRSTSTGRLHFYYRIRDTHGPGAVNRIATTGFGGLPLEVAYRIDGLGTVPPRRAFRSAGPGDAVRFTLIDPPVSCGSHSESRFILIKTPAILFNPGGVTQITATTGNSDAVKTVRP